MTVGLYAHQTLPSPKKKSLKKKPQAGEMAQLVGTCVANTVLWI